MNAYERVVWTFLVINLRLITAAPNEDLVTNLPGLPSQPSFKHYSGYLNSTENNHLHYWFVESQSESAATDPVVLWLNGGPGCSSLTGLLTENGPFRVNPDGKTLQYNEYAWNTIANVLYLESPAGVGYSYTDGGLQPTNDDLTAAQNLAALKSFFLKFPEYVNNEFFITGESYGGIYVPTLSVLVLQDGTINFKGFAIGNGMHDYDLDDKTSLINEGLHGFYSATTHQKLMNDCCNNNILTCDFEDATPECDEVLSEAYESAESVNVNPYYIYDECEDFSLFIASELHFRYRKGFYKHNVTSRRTRLVKDDPDCTTDEEVEDYMNSDSVRTALNILSDLPDWDMCGGPPYEEQYTNTSAFYKVLLPRVRALLYNGDADTVCNYLQAEYFVEGLGLPIVGEYRPWPEDSASVGFVKDFENITFVTIMNAGHMVPKNKPAPALQLFKNFITNTTF